MPHFTMMKFFCACLTAVFFALPTPSSAQMDAPTAFNISLIKTEILYFSVTDWLYRPDDALVAYRMVEETRAISLTPEERKHFERAVEARSLILGLLSRCYTQPSSKHYSRNEDADCLRAKGYAREDASTSRFPWRTTQVGAGNILAREYLLPVEREKAIAREIAEMERERRELEEDWAREEAQRQKEFHRQENARKLQDAHQKMEDIRRQQETRQRQENIRKQQVIQQQEKSRNVKKPAGKSLSPK